MEIVNLKLKLRKFNNLFVAKIIVKLLCKEMKIEKFKNKTEGILKIIIKK